MSERAPFRLLVALLAAAAVTITLFCILPMLVTGTPRVGEITDPVAVNLVRVREVEPPPREDVEPEEEPPPEKPSLAVPEPRVPSLRRLAFDDLGLAIDPSLIEGPGIAFDAVYDVSQVDRMPMPLVPINPVYPYRAQRFSITGYVKAGFVVDAEGRAGEIRIIESVPEDLFDESVRRALERAKFRPGMIGGEPVATRVEQIIRFDLE